MGGLDPTELAWEVSHFDIFENVTPIKKFKLKYIGYT